ncbi:probable LRR receptor-like serine/threonine-protein kinase RKF3 [Humulus lupulus]|uniref:probable LRR receptor-like serine/threonine-protein kinase RKF3 n=1 Tax=Humulus lupulus TaxID=3486 RepID=UPI002B40F4C5|nr:probable LRR receptor-like serine/threonine-protein kinase RKF3 [Humulus lupulus]
MSLLLFIFLGIGLSLGFPNQVTGARLAPVSKLGEADCPLNLDSFKQLIVKSYQRFPSLDSATGCQYVVQGITMLRSEYLQTTGYFSLPQNVSEVCWKLYSNLVREFMPKFTIPSSCGFNSSLLSASCLSIQYRFQFEDLISGDELEGIKSSCEQHLKDDRRCGSCTEKLLSVRNAYFRIGGDGNSPICEGYPFMYAAAFASRFGPTDVWTSKCLFLVDFVPIKSRTKNSKQVLMGILTGCFNGFVGGVVVVSCLWVLHKRRKRRKRESQPQADTTSVSGMRVVVGGNKTLLRFTLEEVKKATGNFSRHNIIGIGGYGNVYKGVLEDGSEVAFKRFKNCSAAWDEIFAHEVEVIASVKHVNLLDIIGYCTMTVPLEGHQRIIVCKWIRNGSLYDHLFGSVDKKLSWPIRQKIALGMARGLAYLHDGLQPAIIHRDVKSSNILVDETFEPKLADFGLARFTQEGFSHVSTKVAGTLGYVSPEYAMYGQLSERSDVYSFGVVLLELLSGKKAVISVVDSESLLLTDWSWSLVKEGRALDIIDEGLPELGQPSEMEKYVLIAVLCSHPVAYARPTMEHVVKMLENDSPVPSIPGRPFPLFAQFDAKDISMSSISGLHCISNVADQHCSSFRSDHSVPNNRDKVAGLESNV